MSKKRTRQGRANSERGEYLHFIIGGLCLLFGACWIALNLGPFDFRRNPFSKDSEGKNARKISSTWQSSIDVNLTTLDGTIDNGALCLDGSPPAYYLDRGTGEGANNWILFLEGGGWCYSEEECLARSFTRLGSSLLMPATLRMEGLVSSSQDVNPDFYNWNRVVLKYCDGGSFSGDVPDPVKVLAGSQPEISGTDGSRTLFFRGQRIWMALVKDLLEHGMNLAENAFLTGCSAGGLATIIHCDEFRDTVPSLTNVKCLSDAGFFINVADISGMRTIEAAFKNVVHMQKMIGSLPISCTSRMEPSLCFFPENLIADVKTPLFLLNPAYDSWQFTNVLIPPSADPTGKWSSCRNSFRSCSAAELQSQLKDLGDFRASLLTRLIPILAVEKDGLFIDSCFLHCQHTQDDIWQGGPEINNTSVRQAVGDWYFERTSLKLIDGPSESNLTCGS